MGIASHFQEALIEERSQKEGGSSFAKKAFDHFLEIGLPTRKSAHFNYFPLTKFYEQIKPTATFNRYTLDTILENVFPECLQSYLVIKDGVVDLALSNISAIASSIVIERLEETHSPYMPFIHAKLIHKQKKETDPFVLLCHSELKGLLLIIPEYVELQVPIQVIFVSEKMGILPLVNSYIHVCRQAKAQLFFSTLSQGALRGASYVDIQVDEGACVEVIRVPSFAMTMQMDAMSIYLKKSASVKVLDLSQPLAPSRFNLHVIHEKEEAKSEFFALTIAEEKTEYHLVSCFEHVAPSTSSHQYVKTLLKSGEEGQAKASFEGCIHVHPEALYSRSYQKHATLMLGEAGIIHSRPNLQILADDVKASHGATLSALDDTSLFYLQTRGLDRHTARALLTYAFCQEILDKIDSDSIQETAVEMLQSVHAHV